MNNLEKLKHGDAKDKTLARFIEAQGVQDLVNTNGFNRGDFFEMCLTKIRVNRTGLHGVSHGDGYFKGQPIEIKYITKSTPCSGQLEGTLCGYYLIGYNVGASIEFWLTPKEELTIRTEERTANDKGKQPRLRIKFKDNYGKGIKLDSVPIVRGMELAH